MVTGRDAQEVGHVKDLRNCHGTGMDFYDRLAHEKTAQRIGLVTVF